MTLLGDLGRPGGVTLAFTERTGGVSKGAYASLNLGARTDDDPADVAENRRRALVAVGVPERLHASLVSPRQVHGSRLVVVPDGSAGSVARAQAEGEDGADAVVCCACDVPVMVVVADCLPVVLVAPGGFAVVHSGWQGTIREVAGRALEALCETASCDPEEVLAYIGPHIVGADYEVSGELQRRFVGRFGGTVALPARRLDLARAVTATLTGRGVPARQVLDCKESTFALPERYFSWRAEGPHTGRIAAIAWRASDGSTGE